MAACLAEADRMIAAWKKSGIKLAINWPMRWYPTLITAYRLLDEGMIGKVQQVNYRNGNRGPGYIERALTDPPPSRKELTNLFFWREDSGGGVINDHICYGSTLTTWYLNGEIPKKVSALATNLRGTGVEDNVVVAVEYDRVLCCLEATSTALTNSWEIQPQPPHEFVFVGERGSISAYDYAGRVRVATAKHPQGYDVPCDILPPDSGNCIEYFIDCLDKNQQPQGPLNPELCRIGQMIMEAARISIAEERTVSLPL